MSLVGTKSLAATVNNVNDAFFFGRKLSRADRMETADWIAARQGLPRSYREMFGPTDEDAREGMRFFTGEHMRYSSGSRHILGEEACRALLLLGTPTAVSRNALAKATESLLPWLPKPSDPGYGFFCCGRCTVAYWRHLAVGGLDDGARRLLSGMRILKEHRREDGRWRRFPFYYTLLALAEIEAPGVVGEMRHAAPLLESMLRHGPKDDMYDKRRRAVAERVLSRC